MEGAGVLGAIINKGVWHGSDGYEDVGLDEFGELFGGEIFIDDGINTF